MSLISVVLRAIKGSPLTNTEGDSNFSNLSDGIDAASSDWLNLLPPATTIPGMKWGDLTTNLLKRRNLANDAWIVLGPLFIGSAPLFPLGSIPTTDVGDILVTGVGRMSFFNGIYAPNNFPTRHRDRSSGRITWATTDLTISPGSWRDADDQCDLILTSNLIKVLQTSGAWAPGNGNNGLFSGARVANGKYYFFIIRKDSDGTIDAGFDISHVAANRPAGYSAYRRVGFAAVNGSNTIYPFENFGDTFTFVPKVNLLSNVGLTASVWASVGTISPPAFKCELTLNALLTSSTTMSFSPSNPVVSPGNAWDVITTGVAGQTQGVTFQIRSGNGAGIYVYSAASVANGAYVSICAYRDFLED